MVISCPDARSSRAWTCRCLALGAHLSAVRFCCLVPLLFCHAMAEGLCVQESTTWYSPTAAACRMSCAGSAASTVEENTAAQRPWLQVSADEVGIAAVHRAFELGLNYFDTAPHYGDGKAEEARHGSARSTSLLRAATC